MKHLETGTIQAFLDGELSDRFLEQATAHIAVCDVCASALLEAEHETAALTHAFAAEKSLGVPTQRIWARLENEIEVLNRIEQTQPQKPSLWHSLAAFLPSGESFNFTSSQIAFAGSLAAIVLFSLVGISVLRQNPPSQVASQNPKSENKDSTAVNTQVKKIETVAAEKTPNEIVETQTAAVPQKSSRVAGFEFSKAGYKPALRNPQPVNRNPQSVNLNAPLPEEKTYLTTIADLTKAINSSGEVVMRPAFRVEYEQNMAVTNKAIHKMQEQARRNPKDENAKRILIASYQNKIDLLNTVAEKSQLMASLP